MKALLIFLGCFIGLLQAHVTQDYSVAKRLSSEYELPILVVCTGSDWSKKSQQCIREFLLSEHSQKLSKSAILFWMDFPELSTKPFDQVEQHYQIKEQLRFDTFPLMVLLDVKGQEVARLSYPVPEVGDLASYIQEKWYEYCDVEEKWQIAKKKEDAELLLTCLKKAQEIGCQSLSEEIKNWATQKKQCLPILVDHYAELVQRGLEKQEEALALRQFFENAAPLEKQKLDERIQLIHEISKTSSEESPLESQKESEKEL